MEVLLTLFAAMTLFLLALSIVGWLEHGWSLFTVLGGVLMVVFAGVVVVSWRRGSFDVKNPSRKR